MKCECKCSSNSVCGRLSIEFRFYGSQFWSGSYYKKKKKIADFVDSSGSGYFLLIVFGNLTFRSYFGCIIILWQEFITCENLIFEL